MGLSAVQSALQKLKRHSEREARFIPQVRTNAPIYNLQTALDTEHVLIFAHAVTLEAGANLLLQPMAEAAKKALSAESLQVMVDAGYVNGEHAARCEAAGVPAGLPARALSKARVTARCLAMNSSAISLRQTLISVLQTRLPGTISHLINVLTG